MNPLCVMLQVKWDSIQEDLLQGQATTSVENEGIHCTYIPYSGLFPRGAKFRGSRENFHP